VRHGEDAHVYIDKQEPERSIRMISRWARAAHPLHSGGKAILATMRAPGGGVVTRVAAGTVYARTMTAGGFAQGTGTNSRGYALTMKNAKRACVAQEWLFWTARRSGGRGQHFGLRFA